MNLTLAPPSHHPVPVHTDGNSTNTNSNTSTNTGINTSTQPNISNTSNNPTSGQLLFANFNQDASCFAVGVTNGFAIFNVEPFRETFRRVFPSGGIATVEMLHRSNLLALVGGGRAPRYPPSKVMIWDDHQNRCIGELKFRSPVVAVRLRRDRVVVAVENRVFVYRFRDLALLDAVATVSNPRGLLAVATDAVSAIVAIPGLVRGAVRVEDYGASKATLIRAHEAELAAIALSADGSRLATASEKGTLVRVWATASGEPLRELRRGMDRAEIYHLAFNVSSTFLAASSDKGTVHVFSLTGQGGNHEVSEGHPSGSNNPNNTSSSVGTPSMTVQHGNVGSHTNMTGGTEEDGSTQKSLTGVGGFLKGLLPPSLVPRYFESEWSFGQVRGIEGRAICAFSRDSSRLFVVCADGTFVVASVVEGECPRQSTTRYLKAEESVAEEELLWTQQPPVYK